MCQDMLHTTVWRSSACHASHAYLPRFSENSILFCICESTKFHFERRSAEMNTTFFFFRQIVLDSLRNKHVFFQLIFFSRFLGLYYPLPLRIQCILNQPLHPLHFGDFGMDRYTLLPNRSKRYTNFEHKHLSLFGWCACFVMPRRLVAFIRGVTVHEVGINRKCFSGGSPSCISTVAGSSYLTWRFRVILAPVRGNRFFSTLSMQIFGTFEV